MADTESPEGLELVGEHGGEEERDVWGNTHVARAVLNTLATRSQAPVRSRVSQPHRGAADRKSTRLNSSHSGESRMPSSA